MICFEGVLHPSLRNLLPPELLVQLSYLPPGLQMLLLNTDLMGNINQGGPDIYERLMELQDNLQQRRGMQDSDIQQLEKLTWDDQLASTSNDQTQCMISLVDFEPGEEVMFI